MIKTQKSNRLVFYCERRSGVNKLPLQSLNKLFIVVVDFDR